MSFGSRGPGAAALILLVLGVVALLATGEEEERAERGERERPPAQRERQAEPPPGDERPQRSRAPRPRRGAEARVLRVVDGDTIEVALGGRVEDVRYIGVDTPESVAPGEPVECFGKRAAELNRRLVEGERVGLVWGAERRDHYGRLLAYVYRGERLINAELLRRGFARTLAIAPNTEHAERFARLQQQAANAGRGLWSAC